MFEVPNYCCHVLKRFSVFSYGVLIWEMLSGDTPYKGLESTTIIYKSQRGELDNLPLKQSFPKDYKQLLNGKFELCMIIRQY